MDIEKIFFEEKNGTTWFKPFLTAEPAFALIDPAKKSKLRKIALSFLSGAIFCPLLIVLLGFPLAALLVFLVLVFIYEYVVKTREYLSFNNDGKSSTFIFSVFNDNPMVVGGLFAGVAFLFGAGSYARLIGGSNEISVFSIVVLAAVSAVLGIKFFSLFKR